MKENNKENNDLLSSWKEIAIHLNCDVRTCQRWEDKLGLPVCRFDDSSRSSVFAYKEELDAWLKKKLNHESSNLKASTKKNPWRKRFFLVFPMILIFLFIFFLIYSRDAKPADFKIVNSSLVILNEKEKELWRYDTGITNLCDEEYYKNNFQKKRYYTKDGKRMNTYFPQLLFHDLDADGNLEVLFSFQTENETDEETVLCFDNRGHILFKFESGRQLKYGDIVYPDEYRVSGFDVFDINHDGIKEIFFIASHRYELPTVFYIIDYNGNILGEYWNTGRITDLIFEDINQDNREEIILVGMNNEYEKPCLFVFDSNGVNGGSPQQQDYFFCKELERGTEKYYTLFPKIEIPPECFIEALAEIHSPEPNVFSTITNCSIVSFDLEFNLKILSVRLSHKFEEAYKKAYEEGVTEIPYDRKFLTQKYASELLYWNGKEWTGKPEMSNPWGDSKN